MASNTSIVTEAARVAAEQNLSDYAASVAAHLNGDYSRHNQIDVFDSPFDISLVAPDQPSRPAHSVAGASVSDTSQQLRLVVTIGTTEYAVIAPAVNATPVTDSGTGSGGTNAFAPVFNLQPVTQEITEGASVTISVEVDATAPVLFQWQLEGVNLDGETGTSLTITNFSAGDVGSYTCVATNSIGQTTSDPAELTLASS